jgi:hypothetical protein
MGSRCHCSNARRDVEDGRNRVSLSAGGHPRRSLHRSAVRWTSLASRRVGDFGPFRNLLSLHKLQASADGSDLIASLRRRPSRAELPPRWHRTDPSPSIPSAFIDVCINTACALCRHARRIARTPDGRGPIIRKYTTGKPDVRFADSQCGYFFCFDSIFAGIASCAILRGRGAQVAWIDSTLQLVIFKVSGEHCEGVRSSRRVDAIASPGRLNRRRSQNAMSDAEILNCRIPANVSCRNDAVVSRHPCGRIRSARRDGPYPFRPASPARHSARSACSPAVSSTFRGEEPR